MRACGCVIDNVTETKASCSKPYPAISILFLLSSYCVLHCVHPIPLSKCPPLLGWFHNPQFEKHWRLLPKFWFPSVCFEVSPGRRHPMITLNSSSMTKGSGQGSLHKGEGKALWPITVPQADGAHSLIHSFLPASW